MLSTYNVFEAARRLAIKNIVWASSETVLGLPFDVPPPYVPVDEEYPGRPETAYRSPSYSARRWRSSSAAGIRRSRSSACASRT
jgi:nucleoside-diphosphate-sugar epimerase